MSQSPTEREDLIRRYEAGPRRLRAALGKVPAEAVKWRPAEGRWSAHEVVCHCADSETVAAARIRFLVAEPNPVMVGYDQAQWAKSFDYHAAPIDLALSTVDSVRANTAALLRRLPEKAWSAEGTHTDSGRYTAATWLEVYAEHLEKHSRQIERNVELWKARA